MIADVINGYNMVGANYYYIDGLQSKRLITKFLDTDDWKEWAKIYDAKDSIRFSDQFGQEKREMKAKMWVRHQLTRYVDQTYGMQWIINKDTGEKIGQCGLLLQDINGKIELEVGYSIFKDYWGQGYAKEGARLFVDFGFKSLRVSSLISLIDPKNYPSQRVAERIGMTRGAFRKWKGVDYYVYRITREDWEKA